MLPVSLCVLVSALLCLIVMCVVFGSDSPLDSVQLCLFPSLPHVYFSHFLFVYLSVCLMCYLLWTPTVKVHFYLFKSFLESSFWVQIKQTPF